jgi:MFS family permease
LVCSTFLLLFLGAYLGPCFAVAQTLAPINMRAMSTALFFFIFNMIALGGGPSTTGWLIDWFATSNNELEATRYALTAISIAFGLSILSFMLVSKYISKDWRLAEERIVRATKA